MIIKIFGGEYEGKTSIAQLIEKTLKENGFKVSLEDAGRTPTISLEERLKIMSGKDGPLQVEIKVIPYGRESRPNYAANFKP